MYEYNITEIAKKLRPLGRTAFDGDNLKFAFSASGFELTAQFDGQLKARLNWIGESGKLAVIIDGDYSDYIIVWVEPGEQELALWSLVGKHTVAIRKLNEFTANSVELSTLIIEGELSEPPCDGKLYFEFYGDSLTAGCGNLSPNRNSPKPQSKFQDALHTYGFHVAREYGADFSLVASSGFGVLTACDGSTERTIDAYWEKAVPGDDIPWSFKRKPDVVFVNIGTNDMTYSRFQSHVFDGEAFSEKLFCKTSGILEYYPDAQLVFLLGHDSGCEWFGSLSDAVASVAKRFKSTRGDNRVFYFNDISSNQLGGDWHPNLQDQRMMAQKTITHLKENNII